MIGKVGLEIGGKVIEARKIAREFMSEMAGKVIHPVFGLPGGVSKPLKAEMVARLQAASQQLVDFAQFSLQAFHDIVLGNQAYVDTILADYYAHKTNYMGMVDANGKNTFYRGQHPRHRSRPASASRSSSRRTTCSTSPSTSSRGRTSSSRS